MSAGSVPFKVMVSTPVSDMVSTSTSSMESDSTPPQVLRTSSGRTLPVELRCMIYRLLFKDSVIGLTWINDEPSWNYRRPIAWQKMKAIHARESGCGIFFASKASQKESAAEMYHAVTWHMRRIHPKGLKFFQMKSFDRCRFQQLSWNEDVQPRHCRKTTWMLKDMKCLSFATKIREPLRLVLPPHHMGYMTLLAEIEIHLFEKWECDAEGALRGRRVAMKCTVWCSYPPYTLENGKIKVDDQRNILWSSRASPARSLKTALLANTGIVDFRRR
jgi:hypothetical protein